MAADFYASYDYSDDDSATDGSDNNGNGPDVEE